MAITAMVAMAAEATPKAVTPPPHLSGRGRAGMPARMARPMVVVALLALCVAVPLGGVALRAGAGPADSGAAVARGAALYAANCAGCHGAALEGQPDWRRPNAAGRLPAPPLDATGHAWDHPDAQLEEFVAHGMASVAPAGYRSDMPAFAGRLSRSEIQAVLAFVRSHWPPGVRAAQAMANRDGATVARLARQGDWTFPPDCNPADAP
ncbi:cytochrome c [Roseomonas sp. NAR14]|uniref:Cytochrome c n=1 Tax=Roseomonas acroporae TaxID=2937791 RepID=A0A9X2BTQ1_9PROT|nr:cytochrome c [Roseomonas acroporae]MCK8783446.1 cytochrome c [Roseomonas acroporae]